MNIIELCISIGIYLIALYLMVISFELKKIRKSIEKHFNQD